MAEPAGAGDGAGPAAAAGAAAAVADRLLALGRGLRARGVPVGAGELGAAARALAAVDPSSRAAARLALRAVLTSRREHLPLFDAAFEDVFGTAGEPVPAQPPVDLGAGATMALPRIGNPDAAELPLDLDPVAVPAGASDVELLHDKDFADLSAHERALARAVLQDLARHGPERLGRRTRPVRGGGAHGRPDLPGTFRAALRTGGEPLRLARRAPAPVPRPLVLLLDVSGSMAAYARMLLQYAQAATAARPRVQAFAFGTRLTPLTRELQGRDPDAALARASAAVADWSGGTRIGEALGTLQRTYGRRLGRGAVVVILSDGWDRGDPQLLSDELARLRRSAHRVIWLNPLKAAPDYEPLARGMAAALPHTDHFLAGHSLRSLAELAALLSGGLDGARTPHPRAAIRRGTAA